MTSDAVCSHIKCRQPCSQQLKLMLRKKAGGEGGGGVSARCVQ